MNFQNAIQGMGYEVKFEHIKGKDNILVDILSRKITGLLPSKEDKAAYLWEEVSYGERFGKAKTWLTKFSDYWKHSINEFKNYKIQGYGSLKTKITMYFCYIMILCFRYIMASSSNLAKTSKTRMTAKEYRKSLSTPKVHFFISTSKVI